MFSPQTNVSKKKKKPGTTTTTSASIKTNKEKKHENPVGPWGVKTEPR